MKYVFDVRELDAEALKVRARSECRSIFSNPDNHRGRSYKELLSDCIRGQAAELWLLDHGYSDHDEKYRDVKNTVGQPVEVKVVSSPSTVHYTIDRCNESKKRMRSRYADLVYVFVNDPADTDYYFHGVYEWNSEENSFDPKSRTIEDIQHE